MTKKINQEIIEIFNEVNIDIDIDNVKYSDDMKSILFKIELDDFKILSSLSNKIRKSTLFTEFSKITVTISKNMTTLEDVRSLFIYDEINDFYLIDIGKENIENIKKIKNFQKMIDYIKNIKYHCILDNCYEPSQESHSISDCFLKKISDDEEKVYALNLIDSMFKINKISRDLILHKDLIVKKKTSKSSVFPSFCNKHDRCFAVAFENSVLFEENEFNCKLLHYRTINSVYVANKIVNDVVSDNPKIFRENIKERLKNIMIKNKPFKKSLDKIKTTKSLIFEIEKTNVMFSGVFSSSDFLSMYAYVAKREIYYPYKILNNDFISFNLFTDNNGSKLILTTEFPEKHRDFFNFIISNINEELSNTVSSFLFLLGIMSLNCYFNPVWYESLNKKNTSIINKLAEYIIFGLINNSSIEQYLDTVFEFDFNDESPLLSDFKKYKIV